MSKEHSKISKSTEYGRPVQGSLTEMRGQKANIHIFKEMLELCEIINEEGFFQNFSKSNLKAIVFRDLFNIYTHISNKVVGVLLRTRKHGLIHFDGEILFQNRDDDVLISMLAPIEEIRKLLRLKQEEICSSISADPQPTTIILSKQNTHV